MLRDKFLLAAFLLCASLHAQSAECLLASDPIELGTADAGAVNLNAYAYSNAARAWDRIADQLADRGNELLRVEGRVVVWADVNFFVERVVFPYQADKLCGETLSQMATRIADNARGMGMGSNSPGGSGGGMYVPAIVSWNGWSFSCTVGGTPVSCEGF